MKTIGVLKRILKIWIITSLLILGVLEVLSFLKVEVGNLGIFIWLINCFNLVIYSCFLLFKVVKTSIDHESTYTVATLLLLFLVFVLLILNSNFYSSEATQEMKCVLEKIDMTKDAGYNDFCFLGYPTRQLYLPAVFSLIFGNSLQALKLGFYSYHLIGIIVFASLVLNFKQNQFGIRDKLIAGLLLIPFSFYFFLFQLYYHEQSLIPVSIGLIIAGLGLKALKEFRWLEYALFTFTRLLLIYSYTPALALFFLTLIVDIILVKRNWHSMKSLTFILAIALMSLSLVHTLTYRQDLNLVKSNADGLNDPVQNFLNALLMIFFPYSNESRYMFISPYLIGGIILILLIIWNKRTWLINLVLIGWSLVTIYFSVNSKGYATPPVDYALHRAIVIIPVLMGYLYYYLTTFLDTTKINDHKLFRTGFIFLLIISLMYGMQNVIIAPENNRPQYQISKYLDSNYSFNRGDKILVLASSGASYALTNINDTVLYFNYPATATFLKDPCELRDIEEYSVLLVEQDLNQDQCFIDVKDKVRQKGAIVLEIGNYTVYENY